MNDITFTDLAILDPSTKNNSWPLLIIGLPLIMVVIIQGYRKNRNEE